MNNVNFENAKTYIENNYKVIEFNKGHCKTVEQMLTHIKTPFGK